MKCAGMRRCSGYCCHSSSSCTSTGSWSLQLVAFRLLLLLLVLVDRRPTAAWHHNHILIPTPQQLHPLPHVLVPRQPPRRLQRLPSLVRPTLASAQPQPPAAASTAVYSSGPPNVGALYSSRRDNESDDNDETSLSWVFQVVLPLWLVYISNQWSRSSIYYLVNFDTSSPSASSSSSSLSELLLPLSSTAMNVDIGFDETQYGILASVAFTSLFAVTSLVAGLLSDRFNRKSLTIASIIGWTVATYGTATSATYESVVAWRIAMGFACAFSTPTAYTLLRDAVPLKRQATASSLYGTGVALGSGLASYTLVLDNMYGWRPALEIIASAGLLATLLAILLLPDDDKSKRISTTETATSPPSTSAINTGDDKTEDRPLLESILSDVQMSFATDRARWIYIGSLVRFCSGLCIGVWGAPYFRMTFADHVNDYAYAQAIISAVGASISGIVGGAVADQLSSSSAATTTTAKTTATVGIVNQPQDSRDDKDLIGRRLWVPVVGSLLAAPAWYMAVHSPDSFEVSMAWLATEYLVAECWFGPTISTLQTTVGPKIGGTAQGLFTLTGAIANFAPSILGYLYGQAIATSSSAAAVDPSVASSSSTELSNLLTAAVCFGYIANAFCFGMAANSKPPTKL
jgi:MFS family permease